MSTKKEETKEELKNSKTCSCEDKITELENSWKRALADYRNLEKRVIEEKREFAKFVLVAFIRNLLPILDNLEKAQSHLNDSGLALVVESFKNALKEEQVEEIESLGKEFNPTLHEAIEVGEGEDNIIISVLEKGYKLQDRVIRPAKVVVGKNFGSAKLENNLEDLNK